MAAIFAQPYYTGQPLGTLSFYLTGSLTLATIYSDEAGTTPLPNPVTADANGRFPAIYLATGTQYRVIEKNDLGVTLADIDPVNPPVAVGGGTISGDIDVVGTVTAQTPNVGTAGGFQLVANSVSGFGYQQALASDGVTQWGVWRYDSTGLARWSGALQAVGAATFGGTLTSASATFNGRARTVPVALTVASTTALDAGTSNAFTAAMTTNISTLNISNAVEGQAISVLFIQDATGSRTIAWPASFRWAGGAAPTLSTAANARDLLSAQFLGGSWNAALIKGLA